MTTKQTVNRAKTIETKSVVLHDEVVDGQAELDDRTANSVGKELASLVVEMKYGGAPVIDGIKSDKAKRKAARAEANKDKTPSKKQIEARKALKVKAHDRQLDKIVATLKGLNKKDLAVVLNQIKG